MRTKRILAALGALLVAVTVMAAGWSNVWNQPHFRRAIKIGGGWYIGDTAVTPTATELNYTDVSTLGTWQASKACTADANGEVKLTRVNAAEGSANPMDWTGTLGNMNGSDDFTFLDMNFTNGTHSSTGNTIQAVDISNITGSANATESALKVGTGWDYGVYNASPSVLSGAVTLGTTTATVGLTLGGGTSGTPLTTATADKSFGLFYTQTTATDGTSRGLYWRHYLGDTTPSGEAARFFTTVSTAGATDVHGAHVSLSYGASGTCTGESAALRSTLHVPAGALGGTNGSLYTELWADAATSDMSNGQFQRYVFGGDGTGIGVLDDSTALFSIEGNSIGAGNMMFASAKADGTHLIRIRVNGTAYYLMAVNAP